MVAYGTSAGPATQGNDVRLPPAPGIAGQLLASNGAAWSAVAPGASETVLKMSAAGPVWAAPLDTQYVVPQQPRQNAVTRLEAMVGLESNFFRPIPATTVGDDGLPLVVYYDLAGNLRVVKCRTASCAAFDVATVDSGNAQLAMQPSIALGADRLPVISYSTGTTFKVLKCGNAACSAGNTITPLASPLPAATTSIATGVDGFPVLVFNALNDGSNGAAYLGKCSDAACSGGIALTRLAGFGAGRYISVAIGADGLPFYGYWDFGLARALLFRCNDTSCSTRSQTTLEATASDYQGMAVTVGDNGFPFIVYSPFLGGAYTLRAVACGDASCSSANATFSNLDSPVEYAPGASAGLTVAPGGFPVITYSRAGVLRYARCRDAKCTSATIVALATTGQRTGTAVTIGTDGRPFIAYTTDDGIYTVKCANAFCLDNWARR